MKFFVHPANKGLVPIHSKYFIRNLTLHHFLLSPVAWNIRVSINLTSYTLSNLAGHANIMQHSRIFQKTRQYCSASVASPRVYHCTCKIFAGLNVSCLWYYTIHIANVCYFNLKLMFNKKTYHSLGNMSYENKGLQSTVKWQRHKRIIHLETKQR